MVFPGGRSPYDIFNILREETIPWSLVHLYLSDERCVPRGSFERNDRLVDELFIATKIVSEKNFHRISAELGPDEGARQYARLLRKKPRFDIVLLGVGEDAHIASLFPGTDNLTDTRSVVPVYDAPKPPSERISIGLCRLLDARCRFVLIRGAEKQGVLKQMKDGADLPVTRFLPTMVFVNTINNE
jgi:6-phosphogluconolactonase